MDYDLLKTPGSDDVLALIREMIPSHREQPELATSTVECEEEYDSQGLPPELDGLFAFD